MKRKTVDQLIEESKQRYAKMGHKRYISTAQIITENRKIDAAQIRILKSSIYKLRQNGYKHPVYAKMTVFEINQVQIGILEKSIARIIRMKKIVKVKNYVIDKPMIKKTGKDPFEIVETKPLIRPPAIYSNDSPYGIAKQLHESK